MYIFWLLDLMMEKFSDGVRLFGHHSSAIEHLSLYHQQQVQPTQPDKLSKIQNFYSEKILIWKCMKLHFFEGCIFDNGARLWFTNIDQSTSSNYKESAVESN